jgi:hypothetical protein
MGRRRHEGELFVGMGDFLRRLWNSGGKDGEGSLCGFVDCEDYWRGFVEECKIL